MFNSKYIYECYFCYIALYSKSREIFIRLPNLKLVNLKPIRKRWNLYHVGKYSQKQNPSEAPSEASMFIFSVYENLSFGRWVRIA